jgi:hypothetical protein
MANPATHYRLVRTDKTGLEEVNPMPLVHVEINSLVINDFATVQL